MMMALQACAAFVLITLPWLNPFTIGPSPAMVPLWFSWICIALCMLVWAGTGHRRPADAMVRAIVMAWLMAATLSAVIGLLQYFKATDAWWPWINTTGGHAAFGNLRQRNLFASLLNMGLAALLWWASHWPVTALRSSVGVLLGGYGRIVLASTAAILIGAANAASASRTGLFQWLMVTALVLYWRRTHLADAARSVWALRLLGLVALSYVAATVAVPWLADQLLPPGGAGGAASALARLQAGDPVCASRLTLWGNVLHLIALKPWTGWGWGNLDYAHFMTLYSGERFCDILDNAHNLPLHLAVELGVPLSLSLCALGAWLVWRARPWRETDATRQMAWAVLALILLHSMLEYPLWYGPFQMAFGLCIWLLWRAPERVAEASAGMPLASGVLAGLLALAVAYAGWDYRRVSQIYLSAPYRAAAYREDTLEKIRDSWLYSNQVRFAELTTSELTPENAAILHDLAENLLHFSPEARVVEKLIDSATLLGRADEALFYQARYQAAFPESYALWLRESAGKP